MSLSYSTWREFIPLIQLSIPKCPVTTMADALKRAAMEFCKETKIWRQTSDAADIVSGQNSYDCTVDETGIDVAGIVSVKVSGEKVTPATSSIWNGLPEISDTQPRYYRFVEPGFVQLWPTPSESVSAALVIEVGLMPTMLSTRGPSFLLTRYDKAMASGAKRNLMLIPDQPWTDLQGAMIQDKIFRAEITVTRISEAQGGTKQSLTVKRRRFI